MFHSAVTPLWARFILSVGALIGGACFLPLKEAFMINPYFNSVILGVWGIGVLGIFWEFSRLWREERVLYRKGRPLTILRPLAYLYERSSYASRQSIALALENCRDLTSYKTLRYISSALIFLGLLGTLWGLSQTILLITEVIGHLPTEGAIETFFETLKSHLQKPLAGMGIAFSSSLFGIAGSLSIGFFLLQLEKARGSFFQHVEEWSLALFKTVEPAPLGEESGVLQATLTQWLEGMERLVRLQQAYDQRQQDLNSIILTFGEKTKNLAELMKAQHSVLNKWVEEQMQSRYTLERIGQKVQDMAFSGDETIKSYLAQLTTSSQEILNFLSRTAHHEDQGKKVLIRK